MLNERPWSLVRRRTYVIAIFINKTQTTTVTAKMLKSLDHFLRRAVKECLHLPLTTLNGFLYASPRDGGLNILNLIWEPESLRLCLTRLNNIREEGDPRVLSLLNVPCMSRLRAHLIKLTEQYGSSKSEVLNTFAALQTSCSGNGLRQGNWSAG